MRKFGKWFWRFMVIFSFIVNIVLVVVLLGAGILIFEIKNNVADPLIQGLHSTSVGLDQATIDWTIPVRDTIPVVLNVPLDTETTVVLTAPVPLNGLSAQIDLPGINAFGVQATVNLTLPEGLSLPVALNLDVPIDQTLDVALDVRAVIPLSETQLHDPIETLGLLFEPLAIALHNLPNSFGDIPGFVGSITDDWQVALFNTEGRGFNAQPYQPWQGYSRTAGLNYTLHTELAPAENIPVQTQIVPLGGIPFLDSIIRDHLYLDGGTPRDANEQARQQMEILGIDPVYFTGGAVGTLQSDNPDVSAHEINTQTVSSQNVPAIGGGDNPADNPGIIPTPMGTGG